MSHKLVFPGPDMDRMVRGLVAAEVTAKDQIIADLSNQLAQVQASNKILRRGENVAYVTTLENRNRRLEKLAESRLAHIRLLEGWVREAKEKRFELNVRISKLRTALKSLGVEVDD